MNVLLQASQLKFSLSDEKAGNKTELKVNLNNETVWMPQQQISLLVSVKFKYIRPKGN